MPTISDKLNQSIQIYIWKTFLLTANHCLAYQTMKFLMKPPLSQEVFYSAEEMLCFQERIYD